MHYVVPIVALRARFETALWYNDIALWCNARRQGRVPSPPKTPPEIAEKLSRAFAELLREPEVEKKWREMALTPVGGTPGEVGAFLKAETARWRNVIVSGGFKRQ